MPEQLKYPTAYENIGWVNPQNADGAPDSLCASKTSIAVGNFYLRTKTYAFTIPSDAVITGVFMAVKFKRYRNCAAGNLIFYMIPPSRFGLGIQVITATCTATPPADRCTPTVMSAELDLSLLGSWVPDDFNVELGAGLGGVETWYRHQGDTLVMESHGDANYLRVTYAVPSVPVPSQGGGGLRRLVFPRKKLKTKAFWWRRWGRF